MSRPPTIGIVGGIGSGKSAVADLWRDEGCVVCHSDDVARQALEDPAIKTQLVSRWGQGILRADGTIDRSRIAPLVFASEEERLFLEGLTHPWIERARRALFASAPPGTKAFVLDAPLLLEVGLDRECDVIVFIDAPRAVRGARVLASRGWSDDELDRRESAQWPIDRKRAAADHVLLNDGDAATLKERARRLLERILVEHGATSASSKGTT